MYAPTLYYDAFKKDVTPVNNLRFLTTIVSRARESPIVPQVCLAGSGAASPDRTRTQCGSGASSSDEVRDCVDASAVCASRASGRLTSRAPTLSVDTSRTATRSETAATGTSNRY